jgi:hypothetical protein
MISKSGNRFLANSRFHQIFDQYRIELKRIMVLGRLGMFFPGQSVPAQIVRSVHRHHRPIVMRLLLGHYSL